MKRGAQLCLLGSSEIMGFNHEAAGFHSAKAMVTSMLEATQQLKPFANRLSIWKLARRSKTGIGAPFHSDTTAQMLSKMTMMGNSKQPLKGSSVLPHVP